MDTITIKMQFKKDTKHTQVYEAISETAPISVLYIKKHGLVIAPTDIEVTINELPANN